VATGAVAVAAVTDAAVITTVIEATAPTRN
jgi:hypothetical protein